MLRKTYLFTLLIFLTHFSMAQLNHVGSMSEMADSNFKGTVYLDTLSEKNNLYGLGPYGPMRGEITIMNGIPMNSSVQPDGSHLVTQTWKTDSPFFVYTNVSRWKSVRFSGQLNSLKSIEKAVETFAVKKGIQSFAFMVEGNFDQLELHVVMPRSKDVQGYVEGRTSAKYSYENIEGTLVGFYSTDGYGIYTPKSSPLHIHFVSKDHTIMGHLNNSLLQPS